MQGLYCSLPNLKVKLNFDMSFSDVASMIGCRRLLLLFLTHSLRSRMSCYGQWGNVVSRNLRRRKWPR